MIRPVPDFSQPEILFFHIVPLPKYPKSFATLTKENSVFANAIDVDNLKLQ